MSAALQSYTRINKTGLVGRALEAAVLRQCASDLQRASQQLPDETLPLMRALQSNTTLWGKLIEGVFDPENQLPDTVKLNVATLARFVEARTMRLAETPEATAVMPLIDINRNLALGLEGDAG